jgi:hypothetical protein
LRLITRLFGGALKLHVSPNSKTIVCKSSERKHGHLCAVLEGSREGYAKAVSYDFATLPTEHPTPNSAAFGLSTHDFSTC